MAADSVSPILSVKAGVSYVSAVPQNDLGTRVTQGGFEYVYVYNGGAGVAQISQGQGGYLSPGSMLSGYTVTVSNAASHVGWERFVGVAAHATIPIGEYGWLMTRGVALIAVDASELSFASGLPIYPGVDGGFVSGAGVGSLQTGYPVGISINSIVTTVGTGKAWIKSPVFG